MDSEAPIVVEIGNAGFEDITLEGERISFEMPTDSLPAPEPQQPEQPQQPQPLDIDLESTDELQILKDVPDSAYPEDDGDAPIETSTVDLDVGSPEPVTPTEIAPAAPALTAAPTEVEAVPLAAQRWRRPADEAPAETVDATFRWRTLGWSLAGLLLALALVAQVAHHFRQELVRHPQLGPPLRAVYERLGIELLPNWDLGALELRQWGNEPDAATSGRLVVRATLTNRASFAQPHPLLRLELDDRFGNTVATRDFEPAEYLKNVSQATRLMAPGASSEAELLLADPGRDAVGYRLDVCLRESAALLRCATGPG
jgi:hypothetical protein